MHHPLRAFNTEFIQLENLYSKLGASFSILLFEPQVPERDNLNFCLDISTKITKLKTLNVQLYLSK